MAEIGDILGLSSAEVLAVGLLFYSMYHPEAEGPGM